DGGENEQRWTTSARERRDGHPYHVPVHDLMERGWFADHFEETLAREGLAPHRRWIRHCLAQLDDNRRQDSASDRQQVRRNYQIRIRAPCLQRGLHLRAVAVCVTDPVGAVIAGDFRKEQLALG